MSTAVCHDLAKTTLDGPVFKLCRKASLEEQWKREQDLIQVFVDAERLARELWTQRTYIEIVDKGGLERFHIDSPR